MGSRAIRNCRGCAPWDTPPTQARGLEPSEIAQEADSSSGRDKSVESFRWSLPCEGLARTLVEQGGDGVKVLLGIGRQVGALRQELMDEAVPVLVAPALSQRIGVAEVDRDAGGDLERGVRRHLYPLIPGEGLGQLVR